MKTNPLAADRPVMAEQNSQVIHGDCLAALAAMPDDSVDLVFGSPPFSEAVTKAKNVTRPLQFDKEPTQ